MMSESIVPLLLLKEIFKCHDLVQYIIQFYIAILPPMKHKQLFFKCSCQKMTRIVKNCVAMYQGTELSVQFPLGKLSFFKEIDIDYFGSFMKQLSSENMEYFDSEYFKTKCEYCEKIWFDDSHYEDSESDSSDYIDSQIMILCKCGKFGEKFPCGGEKCTIVKCKIGRCTNTVSKSQDWQMCGYHSTCKVCRDPYLWSYRGDWIYAYCRICEDVQKKYFYNSDDVLKRVKACY